VRHLIRLSAAPAAWHQGLPLGNGEFGAMVWGTGEPVALTLDRADLWDTRVNRAYRDDPRYTYAHLRQLVTERRFTEAKEIFEDRELRDNPVGPTKISIGRAELRVGRARVRDLTLDLDRALVCGALRRAGRSHRLEVFLHRQRNVLCLRITACPQNAAFTFLPLAAITPALATLGHPEPQRAEHGDCTVVSQQLLGGPAWAVAWARRSGCFFIAAETASDGAAADRALAALHAATTAGYAALRREHVAAWRAFWSESAVRLPETDLERLWYHGIYLLASSAKQGFPPPGLQGLWAMDGILPPWRGDYHADMNVQETFWPAAATGHIELLDVWCEHMRASISKAREFTRAFLGTEGTFWPACTIAEFVPVPCWHTVQFAWSHSGWLAWLVWLRWRYSLDHDWLRTTGYPVVAEVFRFYRENLEADADGRLHVPLSTSPEYGSDEARAFAVDPNVDLALIRRCCDWVVEIETALGVADLADAACSVRATLAPYALSDHGELCLWPGKPLDESHRHPSHLMAIHPGMDLTVEGTDADRAVIDASLRQFQALGQYQWAGHTYAQLISLAAVTGRSGWAWHSLRTFADLWTADNGLHFNADLMQTGMSCFGSTESPLGSVPPFTMEANCAASMGICDMLVQGWGDIVRVFPAVPDHWADVSFRDLRTEGAFRVSATRRRGRTVRVSITAGSERELRLRDPFAGSPVQRTGPVCRHEAGLVICHLHRGETLALAAPAAADASGHDGPG